MQAFLEHGAEAIAGTVEEHPEIAAVDVEFAADLVLVFFVEKNAAEQPAVLFVHFGENAAHQGAALTGVELHVGAGTRIGEVGRVFGHLALAGVGAEEFEGDVVADRVDETRQTGGIIERFAGTEVADDAEKSLLGGVLDEIGGAKAGPQL